MIWLTTLYTLSDVCDCSLFFFRYCILKSSNTPQNLETPILWSKTKKREKGRDWVPLIFTSLRKLMACRHVSKRDALATVNPSNREGETSACGVEPKKQEKTTKDWRRGHRFETGFKRSSRKLLLTCPAKPYDYSLSLQVRRTTTGGSWPGSSSTALHWQGGVWSGELSSSEWGTVPAVGEACAETASGIVWAW